VSPVPLILDVDTGVDDMVMLLYAAASPGAELIGARVVRGPCSTLHKDTKHLSEHSSERR
jgi:inosine-uridine nucleoside N-ribohydrolase